MTDGPPVDAKLKHLEFIEAVISRMATNSFLFNGWALTIAAALATERCFQASTAVSLRKAQVTSTSR